ncbi:MAG: hybrid sensor histidine kinase/response regulator, partial [Alistipes sp.]|nr:hybrid sensor histidine kinase/response regulator [Alistipes sp.]
MKVRSCFLWACFLLFSLRAFASVEVQATHMTTDDGIANNSIRYIYQDSKGFIWMGTMSGLSRYDGNTFVTYRPEGGDKISLSDHRIWGLEEDSNGFLWIFTSADLVSCYDLKRDCFVDFTGCGEHKQHYSHRITDHAGNMWLYNKGNGCRKVTYQDGRFHSVIYKKRLGSLPSDRVAYVFEDNRHRIWIGTDKGIACVEGDQTQTVINDHNAARILAHGDELYFLSWDGKIALKRDGEAAHTICSLGDGRTSINLYGAMHLKNHWVIFTGTGSYQFNLDTHQLSRYNDLPIAQGQVQTDNRGNYWIHNRTGVVWYINAETGRVKSFRLMPAEKVNYIDEERYHIVHDSRDIIWISTYGNGLFAYDLKSDELQHFTSDIDRFHLIADNFLQFVMEDRAGGIWVSSEYTGISRLTVLNEGAERIFPEEQTLTDRSNTVRMINRMEDGKIWLGTRRGGLYSYDAQLKSIESR